MAPGVPAVGPAQDVNTRWASRRPKTRSEFTWLCFRTAKCSLGTRSAMTRLLNVLVTDDEPDDEERGAPEPDRTRDEHDDPAACSS